MDKGFKFESKYEREKFQELSQKIAPEYTFTIRLNLTIFMIEKVPSWDKLVGNLYKFFEDRGIAAKIDKDKSFLSIFEKPIP